MSTDPEVENLVKVTELQSAADDVRCDALILATLFENALQNDGTKASMGLAPPEGFCMFLMNEDQRDSLGHQVYRLVVSARAVCELAEVFGA